MAAKLEQSTRVDGPNGERVQVLFYDTGAIRFRIYKSPLALTEAYLAGGKNDFSIIKVVPRPEE